MDETSIDYASGSRAARGRGPVMRLVRLGVAAIAVCIGLPALLIVGLLIVSLTPPRSADSQFRSDLGVGMPSSTRQLNAARVPLTFIDPATRYELQIAPGDLPTWIDGVGRAAHARGWTTNISESFSANESPPTWWTPSADADGVKLTIADASPSGHGYSIYYSPSSGRVFVFWWST